MTGADHNPLNRWQDISVRRTELACPAHSLKMMTKAAASEADEVIFDLEDGCALSQKIEARKTLVQALNSLEFKGKIRAFRPNSIRTKFFYRDVIEVVEAAGSNIDVMVLPKVQEASDVLFADLLLSQIEQNIGLAAGRIRLEALIESAKGVLHAEQIAISTPRLASLIFGVADYGGDIGSREPVREQFALYHYPKAKTVAAARAAGLDVIDSITLQFRDLAQCEHDAREAARMGFDGKWAIHPDQVPVINRVFTPTNEELVRAQEILELYRKADAESGVGAFVYKDEMIDGANLHIEWRKLAIAKKTNLKF
ncbi:MAG TPA: CoA ester lyase [Candidatus Angelobacter sp.]|jgi:citrate lyase subunit beta/citryl-CoA lyase|nr:CoA ester lyase [Candidatus Angelobacter sp.]